jgi:hypothetical protein
MEGIANEIFVRSMKAMVYMMKAAGMMCNQRCEGMTIGAETRPQHISSQARPATVFENLLERSRQERIPLSVKWILPLLSAW